MGTNGNQHQGIKEIEEAPKEVRLLLLKQVAILEKHSDTELTYTFSPVELWQLHCLLRLGVERSAVKELSKHTQATMRRFREFCKNTWIEHGLTPEEARTLDELGH